MAKSKRIEDVLTRLEEINVALSSETLPLDEALKLYEEGAKLIAASNLQLEKAMQKIEKINLEMRPQNAENNLLEDEDLEDMGDE